MASKPLFIHPDFLLASDTASQLYHEYAAKMPVIDYHNHLLPDQIATNHQFDNITQAWLYGDHYKWRAMRTLGVNEKFITGAVSDKVKFDHWAYTVPYTLRNPLYHWTHLELKRYFDIDSLLSSNTADDIYDQCNEYLAQPTHSVLGLLKQRSVQVVCTTDDPTDDLKNHIAFASQENRNLKMYPTFRPDKFILIDQDTFLPFVSKLSSVVSKNITNYRELIESLYLRADFFASLGCKASDHGLEYISCQEYTLDEVEKIFAKRTQGQSLNDLEIEKFKSAILFDLGIKYYQLNWVQQFHLGALRNNNLKAMKTLGMDTGWDSIGDWSQARPLSKFLGKLDQDDQLAKTIIYNLNPADNELMASMIGNFNDGSMKSKIQFGSAWWFLDQKDGMEKQINALSNLGLISCFIGMLTDSRSFLSFPRHEYFRRILCNLFAKDIEAGELPRDMEWIGSIIQDISYKNVKGYFGF